MLKCVPKPNNAKSNPQKKIIIKHSGKSSAPSQKPTIENVIKWERTYKPEVLTQPQITVEAGTRQLLPH